MQSPLLLSRNEKVLETMLTVVVSTISKVGWRQFVVLTTTRYGRPKAAKANFNQDDTKFIRGPKIHQEDHLKIITALQHRDGRG
jgi:hypothetical protein